MIICKLGFKLGKCRSQPLLVILFMNTPDLRTGKVSLLVRFTILLKEIYRGIPVMCRFCGEPVDQSAGEGWGWCHSCERVFHSPFFKIPGWVAGTLALLAIKIHMGV